MKLIGVILIITAKTETRERIPISPIVGVAALVGGIALVAAGARKKV